MLLKPFTTLNNSLSFMFYFNDKSAIILFISSKSSPPQRTTAQSSSSPGITHTRTLLPRWSGKLIPTAASPRTPYTVSHNTTTKRIEVTNTWASGEGMACPTRESILAFNNPAEWGVTASTLMGRLQAHWHAHWRFGVWRRRL